MPNKKIDNWKNRLKDNKHTTELKWNLDDKIGALFVIFGLLILIYSFLLAKNFVIGALAIDDTFIIKLIFLISMSMIGFYLTNKGTLLIKNKNFVEYVMLFLGLGMLIYSFIIANMFVIIQYESDLSYIPRIIFFFYTIGIGIYFIGKGIKRKQSKESSKQNVQEMQEIDAAHKSKKFINDKI